MKQLRIPAVYMRGGTSKGVFFLAQDLPADPRQRDRLLMRVIGSPDRYGKHTDGMGGATSSTSKVVILAKSTRPDCDVDYLFGQVAIDRPLVDWSGNCGNLSAAVGPFALSSGLLDGPADGDAVVRIWQANISKKIIAHVPMQGGEVQELGDFELDGVAFGSVEAFYTWLIAGPARRPRVAPLWGPRAKHEAPRSLPTHFDYHGRTIAFESSERGRGSRALAASQMGPASRAKTASRSFARNRERCGPLVRDHSFEGEFRCRGNPKGRRRPWPASCTSSSTMSCARAARDPK